MLEPNGIRPQRAPLCRLLCHGADAPSPVSARCRTAIGRAWRRTGGDHGDHCGHRPRRHITDETLWNRNNP
jgi:hypothetical protein